ncbi:MAG TPA: hypothetical protein VKW08_02550 [Xanthobacteraceae bacterium]|nr:hypothetical protein [Xanthobacteraceae bacterium]
MMRLRQFARRYRTGAAVLAVTLSVGHVAAHAEDAAKYPAFSGQWSRASAGAQWDPTKPGGLRQQAPLTAEYQAVFEANLKSLASGNEGYNGHSRCIPAGMPRMMLAYEPIDVIVTPETTYVRDYFNEFRRIFTDGRAWPAEIEPTFTGYSIGEWGDKDANDRYTMLTVETRGFKGPRVFDATGIPMHDDNKTVIKERIFLDAKNPDRLHDEVTTIDDALTRPWTVTRDYNREHDPVWPEFICAEDNHHVMVGTETYFRGVDGVLMPTRKGQPPPPLRGFDSQPK